MKTELLEKLQVASRAIAEAQKVNNDQYKEAALDNVALLLHVITSQVKRESGH